MTETEHFSLRWNNFHSNLSEGFHSLLEEVDLVDVTLAAEGQYLQAHKLVLSVCSPYFRQLFKANPCKHPIVILKDVCHKNLEALLQFMYQGEVNVCQEELAPFLKTAEMLQIKGLTGNDSKSSEPSMPLSQPQSPLHRTIRETVSNSEPSDAPLRPYKRQRTDSPIAGSSNTTATVVGVAAAGAGAAVPPPPPPLPPLPPPLPTSASLPTTSHPVSMPTSKPATPSSPQENKVEYVIPNPKPEPIDYEPEQEDEDSTGDLVQLLHGGETSQPPPDLPPGPPSIFGAVPGLSQDGTSQDGIQGPPASERKVMQALHHELYLTASRGRCNGRVRKRCVHCYEANRRMLGCRLANQKTLKVSTFCGTCAKFPFMCVNCFKVHVLLEKDSWGKLTSEFQ